MKYVIDCVIFLARSELGDSFAKLKVSSVGWFFSGADLELAFPSAVNAIFGWCRVRWALMFVVFPEYFIFIRHTLQIPCVISISFVPSLLKNPKYVQTFDLNAAGAFLISFSSSIFVWSIFPCADLTSADLTREKAQLHHLVDWKFLEQNIDVCCPCINTLLANKISQYYDYRFFPPPLVFTV